MKRKKLLLYTLGTILGLGLVLYPLLSNVLYDLRQDGVMLDYQRSVEQLPQDDPDRIQALELADAYNSRLATGIVTMSDPFASENEVLYGDTVGQMMDLTGSGIIGVVEVPKLSINLPIFYGTDGYDLTQGVGTLEYTSIPIGGDSTHSVLCAHSGMASAKLFSDLPCMEIGDIFYIHVMGLDLAYQVDQIKTVLPEDVSQIGIIDGEDYCTLLTCVPYGVNDHRLLVRGTRVPYVAADQREEAIQEAAQPVKSVFLREYSYSLLVGIIIVAVLALVYLLFSRLQRRLKHE